MSIRQHQVLTSNLTTQEHKLTLYDKIIAAFPELTDKDFDSDFGVISLRNDGEGDYIAKWEYSKPLTSALEVFLIA